MKIRLKKIHIAPLLLTALLLSACTEGELMDISEKEVREFQDPQAEAAEEMLEDGLPVEEEPVPIEYGEVFAFENQLELTISEVSFEDEVMLPSGSTEKRKPGNVFLHVSGGLNYLERDENLTYDRVLVFTLLHQGTERYGGFFDVKETPGDDFDEMRFMVSVPEEVKTDNGSLELLMEYSGQVYVLKIR
ncbi:hypothetical protein MHZ92_11055 [Sporosarcina sp. ACRSL]|nr:hypothetical protein [Sporosarcina sp. ACRSL]